jgi:excisionase family DNA binding protein
MNEVRWLTLDECADYLKIGRTKLYQMAREGALPAIKLGNQWRFDRDEIDAFMKTLRVSDKDSNGE